MTESMCLWCNLVYLQNSTQYLVSLSILRINNRKQLPVSKQPFQTALYITVTTALVLLYTQLLLWDKINCFSGGEIWPETREQFTSGPALAWAQPMQDPSCSGFFILQRMSPHDFTHPSNPLGHIPISAFLPHQLRNTYDQQVLEQPPHLHAPLARHSIYLRGD